MKTDEFLSNRFNRQADLACRIHLLKTLLIELSVYAQCFREDHPELNVTIKQDHSPVTEIDYVIQAIFNEAILRCFPKDTIIGEEIIDLSLKEQLKQNHKALFRRIEVHLESIPQDPQQSYCWIIDPIDGTKGFILDLSYAIGVALVLDGQPVASGIASMGLWHVFDAFRKLPIISLSVIGNEKPNHFYVDKPDVEVLIPNDDERLILVSREKMLKMASKIPVVHPYRFIGMDSMAKYVLVSLGFAAAYIRGPMSDRACIWDHLAGLFLVAHSGGISVDLELNPIEIHLNEQYVDLYRGLICAQQKEWASKFVQIMPQSRLIKDRHIL